MKRLNLRVSKEMIGMVKMIKRICVLGLFVGVLLFAGMIPAADTIGLMRIEAKLLILPLARLVVLSKYLLC